MRNRIYISIIFIFFNITYAFTQTRIYITPSGNGTQDGSSWGNASPLTNLTTIVDSYTFGGDFEVWIRRGTYSLNNTVTIDNFFGNSFKIYGGFQGNETNENQRDPVANPTILDGQNQTRVFNISNTDNLEIDGFTFRKGLANNGGGGGAMVIQNCDVVKLTNNIFRNNTSTADLGSGAAYFFHADNMIIDNCIFENNQHTTNSNGLGGGAIHLRHSQNNTISNSVFRNNSSVGNGGAINAWTENVQIINCEFSQNHSDGDGGAIIIHFDNVTVVNSLFRANSANNLGGAIYNKEELEVTNSTFVNNNNTAVVHSTFTPSTYNNYSTHIYNSIFYGNTPKNADFFSDISPRTGLNLNDDSEKDIRRNIVQEYDLGVNNMIGVNPQFINNANNFRLQTFSPAANAGNNNLYNQASPTNAGASTDLDENPRLFSTAIDYGAYELQEESTASEPNCTNITFPTDGAVDVSLNPNITWNAVSDADGYRISIGTSPSNFDVLNDFDAGNVTNYNVNPALNENTTYYVLVVPYNSVGEAQNCTQISFTTLTSLTEPNCTTVTFPTDGAVDVSLNPNITWNAVSDADGYRISIGTSPSNFDVLNDFDAGNVTNYNVNPALNENTTYYVLVVPYNSVGEAQNCTTISFTTLIVDVPIEPNCTNINFPTDGAVDVSLNPNITWNAVSDADGYRISIGTSPTNFDVLNDFDAGNVTNYNVNPALNENTTYYVLVVPYNSVGEAQNCTTISFTTLIVDVPIEPNCTNINFPTDGAVDVSLNPNITWNAVSDADGYRISIGTSPTNFDVLNDFDAGNVTNYNVNPALNENMTYYVLVVPYNSVGQAQNCTQISFSTLIVDVPCETPLEIQIEISNNDVTVNVLNGNAPYEYSLNGVLWQSSNFFANLPNATHEIKVRSVDGCEGNISFTLSQITNFISPNGDGKNDVLDYSFLMNKENAKMIVADRYGANLFLGSNNNRFIWSGIYNGRAVATGSYWVFAEWTENGKTIKMMNSVLVKNF